MNKKLSFINYVFGVAGICFLLPLILLTFDDKLIIFLPYHVIISLVLIIPSIILYFIDYENALKLVIVSILYPFFLLGIYPLAWYSVILTISIISLGFILPFISVSATWWFYTFGGRVPLPKEHKWMVVFLKNNNNNTKYDYKEFISKAMPFLVGGGLIVGHFLSRRSIWEAILFFKSLSLFCLFGLSLTLGAKIKKESLLKGK